MSEGGGDAAGSDRHRAGDQTARGAGNQTARGADGRTARGADDQTARGGGNQTARGGGDQTARGAGDQTARGAGNQTARGAGNQTARGAGNQTARGAGNQTARGAGDQTARGADGHGTRGARGYAARGAGDQSARGTGGRAPRVERAAPTADELAAAAGGTVPDLVGPGMRVLLVGINPSLYSAWAGRHFARPGNRLWRTLAEAGLTPRRLHPAEQEELLAAGLGVTNLVDRATARADELDAEELRAGPGTVAVLARRWRPAYVAVLGISAYRTAFVRPRAVVGRQPDRLGPTALWVLPNPSGLNASYQQAALTAAYADLRTALDAHTGATTGPSGQR